MRSTAKPAKAATSAEAQIDYPEALAWLYGLQRFGIKLGLENIRRLINELEIDLGTAQVIHVAGTNGKGSVCAMIDSICRAARFRTGLFISPHLVTFRERIRVNGELISEDAVASALTEIQNLIADWDPHPTFFEVTTALALKHFSESDLDVVILETGLGGRLDATNAIPAKVSVITPIDLDHTTWLGDSLEQIAGEKAGIIKSRVPVVAAPQRPEVEMILRARAKDCDSTIEFVAKPASNHAIGLLGSHQKQNAAIALAAIRAAKIQVDDSAIASGLAHLQWPARFQKWDERTIIDGAHNPAAARVLAETWREIFGDQRATLLLAILSDKDLKGICEALAPIADVVLLPKIRSERSSDPRQLAEIFASVCRAGASPAGNRSGCPTISVAASIAEALQLAHKRPNPILITGSLHFAGEMLAYLRGEPAAFEECAQ